MPVSKLDKKQVAQILLIKFLPQIFAQISTSMYQRGAFTQLQPEALEGAIAATLQGSTAHFAIKPLELRSDQIKGLEKSGLSLREINRHGFFKKGTSNILEIEKILQAANREVAPGGRVD